LFKPLLDQIQEWNENKDKPNYLIRFKKKYEEIEDLDTLKKGVVSNMVGVTNFLMQKLPGILVLEDTFKYDPQGFRIDNFDKHEKNADTFGHSEHLTWAGTETYRYFEKMLVRKFEKQGLIPPFADLESLNVQMTELGNNQDKGNKQFGVIFYVDAKNTSQTCPNCGYGSNECDKSIRKKKNDKDWIVCKDENCKFDSRFNCKGWMKDVSNGIEFYNPEEVKKLANNFKQIPPESLLKIKNGDQNAAYNVANKIINIIK
jgi:CRISPR-associated protein Cpf1